MKLSKRRVSDPQIAEGLCNPFSTSVVRCTKFPCTPLPILPILIKVLRNQSLRMPQELSQTTSMPTNDLADQRFDQHK